MKVLIPILHYPPVIGGLETWTQNIAERLSSKEEMFVVTGRVKSMPSHEVKGGVTIFRTSLFTLRDLSYSSLFYILASFPFVFLKSLFLIREEGIDICHCQGFLSGFLGFLFYKLKRIPYIITVQRLETKKGFLRKIVYRNARMILVSSSAVKNYFKEIGVREIRIIPNGIDLKRFSGPERGNMRRKLGLSDEFAVMSVGRLEWRKGFEFLLKATKILGEKLGDTRLFVVGGGNLEESLEKMKENLGLKEKVIFLGAVSREKIPSYLSACDCFILSSVEEGFGIVILEAMAAGLPVVATKVGGILDIIKDGENGVLVDSKSPEQIAEAVLKIHSDKSFANGLVEKARVGLQRYDWDKIAEEVDLIYKESIWKK